MVPRRPYLLRAMRDWIIDCGHTPHIVVDATIESVEAPARFVEDGKIVLNISDEATRHLVIGNDRVSFTARFAGESHHVAVPLRAIKGVYARETGEGMVFGDDDLAAPPSDDPAPPSGGDAPSKRPHLKIVK